MSTRAAIDRPADAAEIEALFDALAKAHADHDAAAIVADAVICDLAPRTGTVPVTICASR